MISKDLKTAVLDVIVKHYASSGTSFSSHDITRQLRLDVNGKSYTINEFSGTPSQFAQEVTHNDVRDVVWQLKLEQYLDCNFNGTFNEYTVNKTAPAPVVNQAIFDRLVQLIVDQTGVDKQHVVLTATLIDDLGFDDLDNVELAMAIEEEWVNEFPANFDFTTTLNVNDQTTVAHLLKALTETLTKHAVKSAVTPKAAAAPVVHVPSISVKQRLKNYITLRHNEKVNPTLKNAQKAVKTPGTSVRDISKIATDELGYEVFGSTSDPFNQWVIRKVAKKK